MKQKYFALPFLFLIIVFSAVAQQSFTTYTVKKGETVYSIARQFHVTALQVEELNGLNKTSILKIGQKIKIPSATAAAKQPAKTTENKGVAENKQNSIHVVTGNETLWSISKKYNVTVEQLQEWNHLKDDKIHDGEKLIVVGNVVKNTTEKTQAATQPEQKTPVPVEQKTVVDNVIPVEQKPVNTAVSGEPASESFFASSFKNTGNKLNGIAATFKTASGWMDKKYYVLINNIAAGSIVAVKANNKIVYAKVLGELPDIKEDDGVLLRISNAAASILGIADSKFDVEVGY